MNEVRCRVKRNWWWIVTLAALEGGFMLIVPLLIVLEPPKNPNAFSPWILVPIGWPIASLCFYGALHMARSLLFEEVIASDELLRWRGAFGPWKSAHWDEIRDFYLSSRTPIVETPQGQLKIGSNLGHRAVLLSLIAERAVNSSAREWKVRVPDNFSRRFDYWTNTQKWTAPLMSLAVAFVVISVAWIAFNSPRASEPERVFQDAWWVIWLTNLITISVFGPLAILFLTAPLMLWRERNAAYQRRHEHLEISSRGMIWQDESARIEAIWDEVLAITALPNRGFAARCDFRVETQNGDFRVWNNLEGINLWLGAVREFAPQVAPKSPVENPELGDEAAGWSGAKVGEGARVFHFRSQNTRLLLIAVTFFSLVLPLMPIINDSLRTPDDVAPTVTWPFWAALSFLTVMTLSYAWLYFARAAIWTDETGLQWRFPLLKTRRVTWSEIEKFGHDERGYFVAANGKRRRLFAAPPVRKGELLQLIAARATKATGRFD